MNTVENQTFAEERALYAADGLHVMNCAFDGPADGESALKEGKNLWVDRCFFNLRYPFWHDTGLRIDRSEMTTFCRAALWYVKDVVIRDTKIHGIKALRECDDVKMVDCDIVSPEFGWSVRGMDMEDCNVESEYFMLRSEGLRFRSVRLKGKYSFQYIENSLFDRCTFHTKDAFWHARNVTVRDSTIQGEYLAWYSENLTLIRCRIIGTQPLCYCKNLRLIDCEMVDTDLAFERSQVKATLTAPVISIKNPLSGRIQAPAVGEIIRDIPEAHGQVVTKQQCSRA